MNFQPTLAFAQQLDLQDPIRAFRQQFIIPSTEEKEKVYFLGNSLGLQPKRTKDKLQTILDDWGKQGVESFFHAEQPWMNYHDRLIGPLSKIVGCLPHEVTVMNNLSVNLHLMLVSFYRPQGKRYKILCEAKAFPSDQYMMETHVKHHGFDPADAIIEVKPREGEHTIRNEDLLQIIVQHREELALVLFGGINYYSGQVFDMQTITQLAKQAGAKVGFDLAHAAGNIELNLHDWNVDFACWCNYKYLNSGPGAVAAAYIHERYHADESIQRFAGWWGYEKETRFQMEKGFKPVQSTEGWQLGTPAILLYASQLAALEIVEEAGWDNINKKRKLLTEYLWYVLDEVNASQKQPIIEFITPRNESEHGCQVSINMLQRGKEIYTTLMEQDFFVDWREPSVIRLAPVPLYNSFEEVWKFGEALKQILENT
jgi:kynureninase